MRNPTSIVRGALRRLELLPYLFVPPCELVVVTGADSSHYRSLLQFLASLRRHEPRVRCIVWDLALDPPQRQELAALHPDMELRTFDYASHPDWFWIKIEAGHYAWKPTIIADMMNEIRAPLLWLDAGCVVDAPLRWIRRIVAARGFYSPRSVGTVRDWTHPETLRWMHAEAHLLDLPNLSGGVVGVDWNHAQARALVDRWKECAGHRECIAPEGSHGGNHRQDQAVLSVLAHQAGLARNCPAARHGLRVQQDCD